MAIIDSAEIDAMLDVVGVDLTYGAETVKAMADEADEEVLDAETAPVSGRAATFLIRTATLPSLVEGQKFTSGGVTFEVVWRRKIDDGALSRILASRVTS